MKLRSPLKYHGGKSMLADWLAQHAPSSYTHRNIVCAGGLGELLGTRAWPIDNVSETVNDINFEVSTFWAVLRDPDLFRLLHWSLLMTPFSQEVYESCCAVNLIQADPNNWVKIAYRFFVMQRMGSQGRNGTTQYATPTKRLRRGMNENVSAWLTAVDGLPEIHERMSRVEVTCMDALDFIKRYDHANAFFYIDPPYLHETRVGSGGEYVHEWTEGQHYNLLYTLEHIKGKFMLSGYKSELYRNCAYANHWRTARKLVDKPSSRADIKPLVYEYIWMNYDSL